MRVLVACEWSGRVRDAFIDRGHDAWSCDLEPGEGKYPSQHIHDNVLEHLYEWDLIIAFPPCTYLANSGGQWYMNGCAPREAALRFVRELIGAPCEKIAIENPVGAISSAIRKPDQIIHPYYFGDPWQKRTCLWLQNLPLLMPTQMVGSLPYISSNHSLGNGVRTQKERGKTFQGIANAMANQWG